MNRNSSETSFAILHERLAAIVTQASSKRVDFVGICCKETAEMFGDVCRSSATIAAEVCLPSAPACAVLPAFSRIQALPGASCVTCSPGGALLHSETPSPPVECRPHENASSSLVAQLLPLPSWGFRRRLSRARRPVPGTRLGNRRDVHASPEEHAVALE